MNRSTLASALAFVGCVAGSIYTTLLLGCYTHEILGHGLTAVAAGGTFHQFQVDPAGHGWAWYDGVPEHLAWIPLWAGIGVNLLFGLVAIGITRLRPAASGHALLALLAVGTTHTGAAVGYSLMGAVAGNGDAAALHSDLSGWTHGAAVVALAASYLLLLAWAMRMLARLIDGQFAPPGPREMRWWFLVTVLAPFAVLAVARPPSTVFGVTADWLSRAALVLVVGACGWWRCGGTVSGPTSRSPLGWRGATAWLLAAVVLGVVTAAWASKGVGIG
jgi:hypothetical protein